MGVSNDNFRGNIRDSGWYLFMNSLHSNHSVAEYFPEMLNWRSTEQWRLKWKELWSFLQAITYII